MRITIGVVIAGLVASSTSGCGKKDKDQAAKAPNASAGDDGASDTPKPALAPPAAPVAKISGPSVTPTVTSSITFVTPKDPDATWFEMAFPCYAAGIGLQPGNKPSDAFTQVSPLIAPALAAADIDLDHDVAAMGGWSCGDGPCIYVALTLRHPERIADMLKTIPGVTPTQVGPSHWSFSAPGAQGTRTIHVRTVPIQWGQALPGDDWSKQEAKATHVLFFTGLMGSGKGDTDPLTALADPQAAPARVKDVERGLTDARERCAVGWIGKNDWQPGFSLDHARFAMAAPSTGGDALTKLIDSARSVDVELEATLTPAPTDADYQKWYETARAWISSTVEPMKAQLGATGPMADAYFDMFALVGTRGFQHAIKGKSLSLSWRTDRVSAADLATIESELESAGVGATP